MKILKFTLLLLVSLIWLGGCSTAWLRQLYQSGLLVDEYRYGDLYRLSSLPQFKDPAIKCPPARAAPGSAGAERTHLYIIGDSFTEPQRLSHADFPVTYFRRIPWHLSDTIQLDPSARNVLLFETVERHFRNHAIEPMQNFVVVGDTTRTVGPEQAGPGLGAQVVNFIRAEGIEDRLESILFSHEPMLWFRELKATLNFRLFNRVIPKVALSHDNRHIFTALDTDPVNRLNAGTSPLSDGELDTLINRVNESAARYKTLGFSTVLLSIIPNKATILDSTGSPENPHLYNRLIERVQNSPALNVPVVDVYTPFRRQRQPIYALGDSHWNCTGRAIWINAVTQRLR